MPNKAKAEQSNSFEPNAGYALQDKKPDFEPDLPFPTLVNNEFTEDLFCKIIQ